MKRQGDSATLTSFDHIVGARKQRRRDCQAEGSGGAQVDHELNLGGLIERNIARPGPAED